MILPEKTEPCRRAPEGGRTQSVGKKLTPPSKVYHMPLREIPRVYATHVGPMFSAGTRAGPRPRMGPPTKTNDGHPNTVRVSLHGVSLRSQDEYIQMLIGQHLEGRKL